MPKLTSMKAVLIRKYGGPEVLELAAVPPPLAAPGEVVIRVRASSVNPVDWLIRDGDAKAFVRLKLPAILGCDLAGEIAEVGPGVTRFSAGDPVFAMMPHDWGAHAELVALREDLVVHRPASLSDAQAAALPTTTLTALQALRGRARLRPGQRVLVNGASGGVGIAAVQIAKAMGASVTAVCGAASFELVKGLGADALIDYQTANFLDGGERYDVVFDCVANQPLARVKRITNTYVTTKPNLSTVLRQVLNPIARLKVHALVTRGNGADLEHVKGLVESGKLRPIIDRTYPLSDIAEAHRYSKAGRAKGKIVLTFP
jgi:NADPH:quinone reductase-like Zn-dependent oxidoreductase